MQIVDLRPYVAAASSEFRLVAGALREKGAERFGKAFGIALAMVAAAYFLIYAPPKRKIGRLLRDLETKKVTAGYAAQYKDLRDKLNAGYALLPQSQDKEQWLYNKTVESLRSASLTPLSTRPAAQSDIAGLAFQTTSIQLQLKFGEFYAWLQSLEATRPLLHLQSMELLKVPDKIGINNVNCEIATVIPLKRFD